MNMNISSEHDLHATPTMRDWETLIACNNVDAASALVRATPVETVGEALGWAVNRNKPEIVAVLAPYADRGDLGVFLGAAAEWGFLECVQVLNEVCSEEERVYALGDAAYDGQMEVVAYLVTQCDPKNYQSFGLQMASLGNQMEVAQYLHPLSNPQEAIVDLLKLAPQSSDARAAAARIEHLNNVAQNACLRAEVSGLIKPARVSKI